MLWHVKLVSLTNDSVHIFFNFAFGLSLSLSLQRTLKPSIALCSNEFRFVHVAPKPQQRDERKSDKNVKVRCCVYLLENLLIFISIARFILRIFFDLNFRFPSRSRAEETATAYTYNVHVFGFVMNEKVWRSFRIEE
jgi:hypothetical protein